MLSDSNWHLHWFFYVDLYKYIYICIHIYLLEESPSKLVRGSFPIEFTPPFVMLSCASQCWGLYGSKELVYFAANLMTGMEMARKLPRLHLVQMHLEPGARLVLTLQTLSGALSNLKACWGHNVTFICWALSEKCQIVSLVLFFMLWYNV